MIMTGNEQAMAARRARMAAAPAILRGAFRPFFLGGAAWALIALVLWLAVLAGKLELPSGFDPVAWHRHEMLFGFVGAIVGGFLLTAIANWTGRPLIAGWPLAGLFGLWVAARAAIFLSAETGAALAAALDAGFYLVLAVLAAREVVAARNRNLPVVGLVLLFGMAAASDHAAQAGLIGDEGLGTRAGTALVIMMISLIGGRIIPAFTRNWMTKHGRQAHLPAPAGRYDLLVLGATAVALIAWTAAPTAEIAGWLLAIAGLLHAARLARWSGVRAARDPLVLILHVGYAWVPVGLLLLGAGLLGAAIPGPAALHALTAGAMATMILAVMTRATLGHTGRPLAASRATVALYVLITAGALLRVASPFGWFDYMLGIQLAGMAWGGAFLLFLVAYGPFLIAAHASDPAK